MTPYELSERLWQFAARVGKVVDSLPDTRVGRHVAGQLVRCGTAAPPNYDEGCAAESRADFVHKLGIALKELRETRGWLRFTIIADLFPDKRVKPVLGECCELSRILGSSIATAKSKRRSPQNQPPRTTPPPSEDSRVNLQFSILNFQFSICNPMPNRCVHNSVTNENSELKLN
jgi:four helix bundle protein